MQYAGPSDERDRYLLGPLVGAGGEGVVYRAIRRRASPRVEVAIKILRRDDRSPDSVLRDRLGQVEMARTVSAPGLVPVLEGFVAPPPTDDLNEDAVGPDMLYLVSPWVEGHDLAEAASNWDLDDPAGLIATLLPIAGALDSMHRGEQTRGVPVIHGDVKPANIIVTPGGRARLLDFGLARPTGPGPAGLGTPGYRSDEAETGSYSESTDRFGFAATIRSALDKMAERDRGLARQLENGAAARAFTGMLTGRDESDLADWLENLATLIQPGWRNLVRRPVAIAAVALAVAAGLGVGLATTSSATSCDSAAFSARADELGIAWHDPDQDCLHSAYELAVTETAVDRFTPSASDVSVEEQIEALPDPILAGCEPDGWGRRGLEGVEEQPVHRTWIDPDRDCLHTAYEINALGTDPFLADSDGDGIDDTFDTGGRGLAHSAVSQLAYLDRVAALGSRITDLDTASCDPELWAGRAAEWIAEGNAATATTWVDSDADCLRDEYEINVTATDPHDRDTDGDGLDDGVDPDNSIGLIETIDVQLDELGIGRPYVGAGSLDDQEDVPEHGPRPRS